MTVLVFFVVVIDFANMAHCIDFWTYNKPVISYINLLKLQCIFYILLDFVSILISKLVSSFLLTYLHCFAIKVILVS